MATWCFRRARLELEQGNWHVQSASILTIDLEFSYTILCLNFTPSLGWSIPFRYLWLEEAETRQRYISFSYIFTSKRTWKQLWMLHKEGSQFLFNFMFEWWCLPEEPQLVCRLLMSELELKQSPRFVWTCLSLKLPGVELHKSVRIEILIGKEQKSQCVQKVWNWKGLCGKGMWKENYNLSEYLFLKIGPWANMCTHVIKGNWQKMKRNSMSPKLVGLSQHGVGSRYLLTLWKPNLPWAQWEPQGCQQLFQSFQPIGICVLAKGGHYYHHYKR